MVCTEHSKQKQLPLNGNSWAQREIRVEKMLKGAREGALAEGTRRLTGNAPDLAVAGTEIAPAKQAMVRAMRPPEGLGFCFGGCSWA